MSRSTLKPDLPFWGLALGIALTLLSGTLVATGSGAQAVEVELTSTQDPWTLFISGNKESAPVVFDSRDACIRAGASLRQTNTETAYGDLICMHRATGTIFTLDDEGKPEVIQ